MKGRAGKRTCRAQGKGCRERACSAGGEHGGKGARCWGEHRGGTCSAEGVQ